MNPHEMALEIIAQNGFKRGEIARFIGKKYATVVSKEKQQKGNRFTEKDYERLKKISDTLNELNK